MEKCGIGFRPGFCWSFAQSLSASSRLTRLMGASAIAILTTWAGARRERNALEIANALALHLALLCTWRDIGS